MESPKEVSKLDKSSNSGCWQKMAKRMKGLSHHTGSMLCQNLNMPDLIPLSVFANCFIAVENHV